MLGQSRHDLPAVRTQQVVQTLPPSLLPQQNHNLQRRMHDAIPKAKISSPHHPATEIRQNPKRVSKAGIKKQLPHRLNRIHVQVHLRPVPPLANKTTLHLTRTPTARRWGWPWPLHYQVHAVVIPHGWDCYGQSVRSDAWLDGAWEVVSDAGVWFYWRSEGGIVSVACL